MTNEVLRIPFESEEQRTRFRAFLKETDRKAGPFIRSLILRELAASASDHDRERLTLERIFRLAGDYTDLPDHTLGRIRFLADYALRGDAAFETSPDGPR